nr:thrombospondin type 3 repeat-containing protein [Myxococcota bacterium]
ATSLQHPYGSRNLVMSGDGSRLFWRGYVYDADLNELGYLGEEIYATSYDGSIAYSSTTAYDVRSLSALFDLPFESQVLSQSDEPLKLFGFEEATAEIRVLDLDVDADGVPIGHDNCSGLPNPTQADLDRDGFGDECDAFVDDPTEWSDLDLDGVGDNSDAFPSNPMEWSDRDRDGVGDVMDAFPDDPTESSDRDLDGVGDNADAFPADPNRWEIDYALRGGDVLVADRQGGLIKIDPETGEQLQLAWFEGFDPHGLTITSDGEIYVTSIRSGAVYHVDRTTRNVRAVSSGGYILQPFSITTGRHGDLLVADPMSREVVRLDPEDGSQTLASWDHDLFDAPLDVVELEADRFYTTDLYRDRVSHVDAVEAETEMIAEEGYLSSPYSLHAVSDERLLITVPYGDDCSYLCRGVGGIVSLSISSGAQTLVTWGVGFEPFDVVTDASGDLLVTVPREAAVIRVDPSSGAQTLLSGGGLLSTELGAIAIVPIPEPDVFALGLASVLSLMALRKSKGSR